MIYGIGVDIVSVKRIAASLERRGEAFAKKILVPEEVKEFAVTKWPEKFLAKRFAVKEAAVKALGIGFHGEVSWQDLCVSHNELGKPQLIFLGKGKQALDDRKIINVQLSISDEEEYAIAYVILET